MILRNFGTTFLILFLFAQRSKSDPLTFNKDYLVAQKGAAWQGAVFECSPYCRLIAIKKKEGFDSLAKPEGLDLSRLKFIKSTDPIYKLLLVDGESLTGTSNLKKNLENELNENSKENSAEDIHPLPPEYAKAPYGIGWSITGGPILREETINSDTEIQNKLQSKSPQAFWSFHLDLTKGSPLYFYTKWFRPQLTYNLLQSLSYNLEDEEIHVTKAGNSLTFSLWLLEESFQLAPTYSYEKAVLSISTDSLSHFSFSQVDHLVGLAVRFNQRWIIQADYLLSSETADSQSFRVDPFSATKKRVTTKYCSKDISIFDFDLGFCGFTSYSTQKQSSGINSNFSTNGESNIESNSLDFGAHIRLGEDFYK